MRSEIPAVLAMLYLLAAAPVRPGGSAETRPAPGPGDTTAVIEYLEGRVSIDGTEAAIGQEVPPGATISTGADSFCEVVFPDRNVFRMRPDSVLVVSIDRSSLALERGALAAVFDKLRVLGTGGTLAIETPTSAAGVRGTVFFIRVESPDSTYVCTCNGILSVSGADQKRARRVRSHHHKAYRFTRRGEKIERSKAGMEYHTDRDMESLAARIAVSIDWGRGY
jgi:hypothetical protein